jgi:hypothetical protein
MFVVIMEVMGARRTQGVRKSIILANVFILNYFHNLMNVKVSALVGDIFGTPLGIKKWFFT